ncbi:hypothetical protein ACLWBD_15445 [Bdellovibrio sp. HCB117]|uniref:hypothetical protein n=1 Tax=Bdellovibrio sp. HCB117 TaxID=3394359 RepID=UPI0039B41630
MDAQLIQAIIVPLSVFTVFYLLGKSKRFALTNEQKETTLSPEQEKLYSKYMLTFTAVYILAIACVTVVMQFLFNHFANLYNHFFYSTADATLKMPTTVFLLPALFLGFIAPTPLLKHYSVRFLGNETYQLFNNYASKKTMFNTSAVEPYYKWMILICFSFYALSLNATSSIQNRQIHIKGFLPTTSKKYSVDDIKKVTQATSLKAPNGNIVTRMNYRIEFKDGYQWDLDDDQETRAFLQLVIDRTNISVTKTDLMQ